MDDAVAWVVANGAIISVDHNFTDWFGYKSQDLVNTYVTSLVADPKALMQ